MNILNSASDSPASDRLAVAWRIFKRGNQLLAKEYCENILAGCPSDIDAHLLLSIICDESGAFDDGLDHINTYLRHVLPDPIIILQKAVLLEKMRRLRDASIWYAAALALAPAVGVILESLLRHLTQRRQFFAAQRLAARLFRVDPSCVSTQSSVGDLDFTLGNHDAAAKAFYSAICLDPGCVMAYCNLGITQLRQKALNQSLTSLKRSVTLDMNFPVGQIHLADALTLSGQSKQENRWRKQAQMVLNRNAPRRFTSDNKPRLLILRSTDAADVPMEFLFDQSKIDIGCIFCLSPDMTDGGLEDITEAASGYDLVFSAISEPDAGAAYLQSAEVICRSLSIPILNTPMRVREMRRDFAGALFANIDNVVVPKTIRLPRSRPALKSVGPSNIRLPALLRPVGSHNARDLVKIRSFEDIPNFIGTSMESTFYLTEFYPYQSLDGLYRKYRFIFVDGQVFPYHLAIMDDWKVSYWRTNMAHSSALRAEEEAFLRDYESALGSDIADALRAIACHVRLDFFGLDCAVTRDGKLLIFEANAHMWIHLHDDPSIFAFKHRYVPRIFDAITRMVLKHSSRLACA